MVLAIGVIYVMHTGEKEESGVDPVGKVTNLSLWLRKDSDEKWMVGWAYLKGSLVSMPLLHCTRCESRALTDGFHLKLYTSTCISSPGSPNTVRHKSQVAFCAINFSFFT